MTISRRPDTVLLIAANGSLPRKSILAKLAASADRIAACDGAADRLLAAGIRPELVAGDMDSLKARKMPKGIRIVRVAEQDSTDLEKVFRILGQRTLRSSVVFLAGLTGRRTDFTLYNLRMLERFAGFRLAAIDDYFAVIPVRKRLDLDGLRPGRLVSFLPFRKTRVLRAAGFAYPLTGLTLIPGKRESVSNKLTGSSLSLRLSSGSGLLFVDLRSFVRGLPWVK